MTDTVTDDDRMTQEMLNAAVDACAKNGVVPFSIHGLSIALQAALAASPPSEREKELEAEVARLSAALSTEMISDVKMAHEAGKERDQARADLAQTREALELLLPAAMAFEKQASAGTGGKRGGPVFEKARKVLAATETTTTTYRDQIRREAREEVISLIDQRSVFFDREHRKELEHLKAAIRSLAGGE